MVSGGTRNALQWHVHVMICVHTCVCKCEGHSVCASILRDCVCVCVCVYPFCISHRQSWMKKQFEGREKELKAFMKENGYKDDFDYPSMPALR